MSTSDGNPERGGTTSDETLREFASWFATVGFEQLGEGGDHELPLTRSEHYVFPETGAYLHRVGIRVDDLRAVTFQVSHAPDGKEDVFTAQFMIAPRTVIFLRPGESKFASMVCHGGRMSWRKGPELVFTDAGGIERTGQTLVDESLNLDIGPLEPPLKDMGWPVSDTDRQVGIRRDAAIADAHRQITTMIMGTTAADISKLPRYDISQEINIRVADAAVRPHIAGDIVQMLDDFLSAHGLPNHDNYPRQNT